MPSPVKLLFADPPIDFRPARFPSNLLERSLPSQLLYESARQAYSSQEESLRNLQSRAGQLLSAGLVVATGVVWCYVNTEVFRGTLAFIAIAVLALGLALLIWALKPIPYLAEFSAEELIDRPDNVVSQDQFVLWLALGYKPLIGSAINACKAIAYRLMAGCTLLVSSLVLLTLCFAVSR